MPGFLSFSRLLRATIETATSLDALPFSIAPVMFAWIWFLATVSSAISWCRKPMGLSLNAGSPSRSSIFSITPSRRAATEDFSIQSTVASSSSTSAVTAGLAGDGWSWPFWANVATLRVVSNPSGHGCGGLDDGHGENVSSFKIPTDGSRMFP